MAERSEGGCSVSRSANVQYLIEARAHLLLGLGEVRVELGGEGGAGLGAQALQRQAQLLPPVRAAGGVATDIAGRPWTVASPSLVAGTPTVHAGLMRVIGETIPEWTADVITPESTTPKETRR